MNKIKQILWAIVCLLATTTVTSCLNSNDDNDSSSEVYTLTDVEKANITATLAGSYSGYIYFFKSTSATYSDSIATQWTIATDNTLVLKLPLKALAGYISTEADKASVENTTTLQNLAATITVPDEMYSSLYNQGYYTNSLSVTNNQISYPVSDNKTLTIILDPYLYFNNSYIYSSISYYKSETLGYIIVKDLQINGQTYEIDLPIWFDGVKL
jgi:hypothetical protein